MRILIVDDDNDILFLTKYYFNRKGWQVATADNCNQLMETIAAVSPNVIIMDNSVPDEGGIAATQKIRSKHRDIPVIYCSAHNNIEKLATAAGADVFIKKPFKIAELEQIAKNICGEKII